MKKGLKFLAGALAAVTVLTSALAMAVSAESPVYTDATVGKAPVTNKFPGANKIPGTNTEFNPSIFDCMAHNFADCSKHNCWWWNNVYGCDKYDYGKLVEVDLSVKIPDYSDDGSVTYVKSNVPWGAVRRVKTTVFDFGTDITDTAGTVIGGVINNSTLLVGGKYYPANLVNIKKFFENNTHEITMYKGQVQFMNTGYKMYSENSNVVICYNDGSSQVLKAVGTGTANVYFYTNGGVPFLRLSITVKANSSAFGKYMPVVDIRPAAWNLTKAGDSTTISVFASEDYSKDIALKVVYGKATIEGNKVTAKDKGAVVIKAYSESTPAVCGYAVLYVGQYTSSIIDGTWKPTQSGICGNFWNPNLWWCEGGYTVSGWVQVGGVYIPVIKECEDHTNHLPGANKPTTKYYTLRELINMCRGDLELVQQVIKAYKDAGITYYDEKYSEIVKNLKDLDLFDYYFAQLH